MAAHYTDLMRALVVAVLAVGACKPHEHAQRHVALPPGHAPMIDHSPNPTFPTTRPRIEARKQGGIAGVIAWEVKLWDDGTIELSGEACHGTSRATLPPSRVRELAGALDELDLEHAPRTKPTCVDEFTTRIVASGHALSRDDCGGSNDATLDNALDLLRTAVSTVPCDQRFLK